ncbi:MAG: type II toxin-antitoxin system HicB family antitoxin [Chloroflexota bacterium]|nr:type II toxin-antitoxin system HicB family antitoxin [Chloroflexota bacterium]
MSALAKPVEETTRNIQEAIELHLEGMREDGEPIPEPRTRVAMIEVAAVGNVA